MNDERKKYKQGILAVIGAGLFWGFLPIYWQSLRPIDSFVIIFYRIILMALLCYIASVYTLGIKNVFTPMFKSRKALLTYVAAGVVISINWSLYIWAVNSSYVIQTCMGYYLEPLVVCLFGVIFYKERANKWKKIAILLAVIGLLVMVIGYRQFPLIAVGLALSFAIYCAVKKSIFINPLQSLLYETICLTPFALIFVIYFESKGIGALSIEGNFQHVMLLFAGIATVIPLGLFSFAANKLPMITLGLLEYISPSISLILGIYLFNEPFDLVQFIAFAIIWVGLGIFTYGEIVDNRRLKGDSSSGKEN